MMTLMAFLLKEEFPKADMDKVIRMCIIHDLGEAFTGDIPVFNKTAADEAQEETALKDWVRSLPEEKSREMLELYAEMDAQQTLEAKIYKTLDNLEAVIQHNFSPISTWLPNEYELNQTYATERVKFSDYMIALREEIRKDTVAKIENAKNEG
jgi:putative hydrolase of HD superfamily